MIAAAKNFVPDGDFSRIYTGKWHFSLKSLWRYVRIPLAKKEEETNMASKRDEVILKCTECGEENYISSRNKKTHPVKMEISKYCPKCRKKTLHKEKK